MTREGKRHGRGIGEMLTLAARLHRARSAALLGEIGLYPGQDQALQLLAAHEGGLTMGDLAAMLQVKPPTASKMIGRLAQQGLVGREGVSQDGRRVRVALTEEGRKRVELLPVLAETLEKELTADLDGKDRRRLRKLLRRMTRSLSGDAGDAIATEAEDELDAPAGEAAAG